MKFILAKEETAGMCQNVQTHQKQSIFFQMGQAGSFLLVHKFQRWQPNKQNTNIVQVDINFFKALKIFLFLTVGHSAIGTNYINMWSTWLMNHTHKYFGTFDLDQSRLKYEDCFTF